MTLLNRQFYLCLLLLIWVLSTLSAETGRYHGAIVLLASDPSVVIKDSYNGRQLEFASLPNFLPGLISFDSDVGAVADMQTSNELSLSFAGPGYCAIERFEERIFSVGETVSATSQMIITLRSGTLSFDCRSLATGSVLTVETPIGRITTSNALWSIEVIYNERNQNYNLAVECLSGSVRLITRSDRLYDLSGGRLYGVGKKDSFSIEVTDLSAAGVEQVNAFTQRMKDSSDRYDAIQLTRERTLIRGVEQLPLGGQSVDTNVPIIIEYARQIDPMIPFRGVIEVAP